MEIIDIKTKRLMEKCKERAWNAGLRFDPETMEYIVTNRDLLELSPKIMIPTLYDYWVHDVEVLKEKGRYEVYPSNPYETVINTRPAISFYNDNNPDWLNCMIFYHVLAHIDFFQNNIFFSQTWNDDFKAQALADKRLLDKIRAEQGSEKRWVDYVIEFTRAIDNLVGYHKELNLGQESYNKIGGQTSEKIDFYFGEFCKRLFDSKEISTSDYLKEFERYNGNIKTHGKKRGEKIFFEDSSFRSQHPEFSGLFKKHKKKKKRKSIDLIQYLMNNSDFLRKEKNEWMRQVMQIVRRTSLFFQPQIRTKIINEGWASYWHEELFLQDEMLKTNETNYSKVNAGVVSMPRVGVNPYAVGKKLLEFIKELADKGKFSWHYQMLAGAKERKDFVDPEKVMKKGNVLFDVRRNLADSMFINFLPDNDFEDFVRKNRLFIVNRRLHPDDPRKWQYYIKSKSGEDYRKMLQRQLYHPPHIEIDEKRSKDGTLRLNHFFEGRSLVVDWIKPVLRGIEFLWRGKDYYYGGPIQLETTQFEMTQEDSALMKMLGFKGEVKYKEQRVVFTMSKGVFTQAVLSEKEVVGHNG